MKAMKPCLLAAALLPYTLQVTGQGPFYAKAGVPSCLLAARDEASRQRDVVKRVCARDGGALIEGKAVETLVQGVHCTTVLPLTCELPGRAAPPPVEPEAPRS